ncbi:MAG: hypothetical protein ACK5TH_12670 [Prosthecobacter sp.]
MPPATISKAFTKDVMPIIGPEVSKAVKDGRERACKLVAERLAIHGFNRGKRLLFSRRREHTLDVIALESFDRAAINYRVSFDVSFAIRVLNDETSSLSLNGPRSDVSLIRAGRYHMSFNSQTDHMLDRCIEDILRFIADYGLPWFERHADCKSLISSDSPISADAQSCLDRSIAGLALPSASLTTAKLLGLK